MSGMHGGSIAIVGAAETDEVGVLPEASMLELHAQAAFNALADAGLSFRDVDGLATAGPLVTDVAHHLGIAPRWLDGTMVGGCSFLLHVRHAAAAIAAGAAEVVLITHGESGRSGVGMPPYAIPAASIPGQFAVPYGAATPYSTFTIPAMRFLHERGMGPRDLAEVVVAQRKWAMSNDRAFRRRPTDVDEVLAGSLIAAPFTRDMCCVVTDGGGALVLTRAERARNAAVGRPGRLPTGLRRVRRGRADLPDGRPGELRGIPAFRGRGLRDRWSDPSRHRPPDGLRRVRTPSALRPRGPWLRRAGRVRGVRRGGEHQHLRGGCR